MVSTGECSQKLFPKSLITIYETIKTNYLRYKNYTVYLNYCQTDLATK